MDPSLAARRICVAVDVENYSARGDLAQEELQRSLSALLRGAHAAAAPAVALARQPSGDGEVALVDPPADEAAFLSRFVHSLWTGLGAEGERVPFRLRVAVHCGIAWIGDNGFVGRAVVKTCRMLDSAPLRTALRDDPGTRLALMVSDSFYDDVIRGDPPGLAASRFTPARIGGPFDADAWTWTGGRPRSTGAELVPRSAPPPPKPTPPKPTGPEQVTAPPAVAQLAAMSVTVHPDARIGTLIQAAEITGGIHLAAGPPREAP
ncbi:hypothetical protein GCM10022221_19620 [Actinocorallia aurea]